MAKVNIKFNTVDKMYSFALLPPRPRPALPPPPPPPSPPPPPPDSEFPFCRKDYVLTDAELDRFVKLGCRLANLDPTKGQDRAIFRKRMIRNPTDHELLAVKMKFTQHPDTEFMTSPPRWSLPVPQPTKTYEDISTILNKRLESPRDILLILDLNGTLLLRKPSRPSSAFWRRARLAEFLEYGFSKFKVMIWTTAQPENAKLMRDNLLTSAQKADLVRAWDRNHCGLTKEMYKQKTTVYKRLEWVWDDTAIQATHPKHSQGECWDQTNTILVDDSVIKATAQPFNHILVPEFTSTKSDDEVKYGAVLEQVAGYLEEARFQENVSAFMRDDPFAVDEKVGGDSCVGGWYVDLLKDELDPTGELYPANGGRNFFMMGFGDKMMNWG